MPQRTDLGEIPRYNCQENKTWLYGSQEGNCAHCNTHFEMRHLEVDHIIARSKGGTDHIDNLQMLCGSCNRIKGNRGMAYLRK
ncbi:MAG: HNH endonuclease [Bacteroidetes bacterium]|nr:HNH endonuclease [Bacteroidota bacterium]